MTLLRNNNIVVAFKKELVRQFYAMRKFIIERQSKEWFETRKHSKSTRMTESDTIKRFIEYARSQGSEHPNNYYRLYSTLVNKTVGISKRDEATIVQLNNLTLVESIIFHTIEEEISKGIHYKKIYDDCKKKIEVFKSLVFVQNNSLKISS
ncbi:hypothetical protein J2Z76_001723 [Sedimentibacter acidaminivorans]|uniref:Uncharacterized protein n=1 Tax=Sedimentibacter acidaminivorans TaxID=913099 RepID=A0ABS4GDZ0_9FIRM|nr:hypothetical protein [Sedimentibacter acidaminivorans]MBP1925862.1 hypothetical protein [Sedimentibacter acidaminivorans]